MKTIVKLLIFIFVFIIYSCKKDTGAREDTTIWIYKTKNDYSLNVPVELSEDKTRITSSPGYINTRWPVRLIDKYFLNGSMGTNTAFISLTIEEFNKMDIKPGVDSLYKLIIDKDPFIEFYYRDDSDNKFYDKNGAFGIDTTLINELIRTKELEKYFERLK